SRKWVFMYRHGGRLFKHTIGDAASDPSGWTLARARIEARRLRTAVEGGRNPAADKAIIREQAGLQFSAVARDYLAAREPNMKPRSYEECDRHLNKHWKPLHRLSLASIDRALVAGHLRKIAANNGPVAADRARSTISAMFAWCVGEGVCGANPVIGTN